MPEAQADGVKGLAGKPPCQSVPEIAQNRMAQVGQMHPKLVGPSRFRHQLQESGRSEALEDPVPGHRIPRGVVSDSHPLPVDRMPADGRLNRSLFLLYDSLHDGLVDPANLPPGKLAAEIPVGLVVLSDNQQPGGVPVESVDDPWFEWTRHRGETRSVGQEGIDQRAGRMARGRVDDQPGRFVDHEEPIVLVKNMKRDRLRLEVQRRSRWWNLEKDLLPRRNPMRGLRRPSINLDAPLLEQALNLRPRSFRNEASEIPVDPLRRGSLWNPVPDGLGFRVRCGYRPPGLERSCRAERIQTKAMRPMLSHWKTVNPKATTGLSPRKYSMKNLHPP